MIAGGFGNAISHFGSVAFTAGGYQRSSGSKNWSVAPILGFDPPVRLPLGMVRIEFSAPVHRPYTVLLTAHRAPNTPLLSANYGSQDENGFVVHLWETIADRTVQNGGFSFAVLLDDGAATGPLPPAGGGGGTDSGKMSLGPVAPDSVRVWRGYALDRGQRDQFHALLGQTFIPITPQIMAPLGLTAYLPAVVPPDQEPLVPDEIALVFYRSQDVYRAGANDTAAGRAYQKLHASVFALGTVHSPTSASSFPVLLQDVCTPSQPYHLFADEVDWSKGASNVFVGVYDGPGSQLAEMVGLAAQQLRAKRPAGLDAMILEVVGSVLIYWQHWTGPGAARGFDPGLPLRAVLEKTATVREIVASPFAPFAGITVNAGDFLNVHLA